MKHRKLRIAWSVVWSLACVLLIVLWVRSYHIWDAFSSLRYDLSQPLVKGLVERAPPLTHAGIDCSRTV